MAKKLTSYASRAMDKVPPSLVVGPARSWRTKALRRSLRIARRRGNVTRMRQMATLILRYAPDDVTALEAATFADDALAILARGYPTPPRADAPAYDPDPRSVLSVLSQSLPQRAGGYATRSHGILSALSHRGWDVAAITRLGFPYNRWPVDDERTVPTVDTVGPIAYHRALDERRRYPQHPLVAYSEEFAGHVERLARERRAAVIHASSFYATAYGAAIAARRLGIPFVYEMRGLEDLMRTASRPELKGSQYWDYLVRTETDICHLADEVLVITEALRTEMVRRGVAPEKISVLPNGVHASDFTPEPRDDELAAALGLTGKTVIGYAGGVIAYEGLPLLMEAVAELASRRDDFAVVIVGDGPNEGTVRNRVESLGLTDKVLFTGRVGHDEVHRYLSLFDITPFPRLPLDVCELISPMKPFEAMATEKAVVVSSVAALTEIVQDGRTGLVFQAGDAPSLAATLERLIDDPALRAELGAQARAWVVENRDWSAVTGSAEAAYARLLAR
ncbi:glycosyltransferase family 4 protein [Luteimicrobium subarcticum]|uniref:D-inositol 3-phosphate glycosyltransferase n=1 Tax=Luteimicrobium subarcticum TaxID=620910 RepID=A0A2M8WTN3_9MICO|nr:glycosyltransferase family 4 protein [Luteimicrobium subarcticum]PJI94258.1 glycosyltransferase involved in cell wall biosynthesis [Luteimicrobium subarcticum]